MQKELLKVVIESPLRGNNPIQFQNNYRYALWCCRWVRLQGHTVYASHIGAPLFLDDMDEKERQLGISLTQEITDNSWEHWFMKDLGFSGGMRSAHELFIDTLGRTSRNILLHKEAPDLFQKFKEGAWPPHTPGLQFALPT